MKKLLYSIVLVFFGFVLFFKTEAQNPNAVHYYVLNPQLVNGAAIVNSDRFSVSGVYKQLPAGSGSFFINAPTKYRKVFIGVHFENYTTRYVVGNTNSLTAAYRITRKRGLLGVACTFNFDSKTYRENAFAIDHSVFYRGPATRNRQMTTADLSAYYYNHRTAYGLSFLNINEPFLRIDSVHRAMDVRNRPLVLFNYMRRFGGKMAIIPYFTWYRTLNRPKEKEFHFLSSFAYQDTWEAGIGIKGGIGSCLFVKHRTPNFQIGFEITKLKTGGSSSSIGAIYYFRIKNKTSVSFKNLP